jgi:hypothetical protein
LLLLANASAAAISTGPLIAPEERNTMLVSTDCTRTKGIRELGMQGFLVFVVEHDSSYGLISCPSARNH